MKFLIYQKKKGLAYYIFQFEKDVVRYFRIFLNADSSILLFFYYFAGLFKKQKQNLHIEANKLEQIKLESIHFQSC